MTLIRDPWTSVVSQLVSNYDDLKEVMETGPKIIAKLHKVNLQWRVRIEENWTDTDIGDQYYTADYSNLDARCKWSEEQLASWKFAIRLSHQEWKFFTKRQAEKFVTLFNLKWAQ